MNPFKILEHNHLTYQLRPFSVRQLLYLEKSPSDVYGIKNGIFEIILAKNDSINRDKIKELISEGHLKIFFKEQEAPKLLRAQQDNLRKVTRSLSVGEPIKNAKKQMNLLTIHMEFLYQNPTDDERLNLQYQSVKNLCTFLIENLQFHEKLFNDYIKQKHHYIFAQPMISSVFLIGVLKSSRMFSDREIESLFIASYFKDIGMSAIPTEKYDEQNLSQEDKITLSQHASHSVSILKGRIPLSPNHLNLIENHHAFSLLKKELNHGLDDDSAYSNESLITGSETVLVNAMDIIAAMLTGRPYRKSETLFDSLDFIRRLIADEYSQEFKVIVNYFKTFKAQF